MDYNYKWLWKNIITESMMQLIKYEGRMLVNHRPFNKIKVAAKYMYLVYQNPELQLLPPPFMRIYIQYK